MGGEGRGAEGSPRLTYTYLPFTQTYLHLLTFHTDLLTLTHISHRLTYTYSPFTQTYLHLLTSPRLTYTYSPRPGRKVQTSAATRVLIPQSAANPSPAVKGT